MCWVGVYENERLFDDNVEVDKARKWMSVKDSVEGGTITCPIAQNRPLESYWGHCKWVVIAHGGSILSRVFYSTV